MIAEHEAALQAIAALSPADREIVISRLTTDAQIARGHVGQLMGDSADARAEVYQGVAAMVGALDPAITRPESAEA